MIVSLTGVTEVGAIPRGIGLERLRWDGSQIVDLLDLTTIWVKNEGGWFSLHAIQVPGSQAVAMAYGERFRLREVDGVISLYTQAEWDDAQAAELSARMDTQQLKAEAIDFILGLSYAAIDQHINTVFGGLTAAQKTSLKRLYKIVLFLGKSKLKGG